jgi:hypothetical protein
MVEGVVAECFWPGVTPGDVESLDRRVRRAVAEVVSIPDPVRYLGCLLLPEDEVVLLRFAGPLATVEAVAARARVPYERLLASLSTAPSRKVKRS